MDPARTPGTSHIGLSQPAPKERNGSWMVMMLASPDGSSSVQSKSRKSASATKRCRNATVACNYASCVWQRLSAHLVVQPTPDRETRDNLGTREEL